MSILHKEQLVESLHIYLCKSLDTQYGLGNPFNKVPIDLNEMLRTCEESDAGDVYDIRMSIRGLK